MQPSSAALRRLILPESKPFRLLCLDPAETEARVFTWDGNRLSARKPDHGDFGMLTSSSWNTAAVVASRHSVFRRWWKNHAPPSQADLEAFHRDTRHPRGRAWAVCMSRDDARTVSLTTIRIRRDEAIMSHWLREKDEEHFAPTADTAHLPLTSAR